MLFQHSNNCKVDIMFFLQVGKLRLREIQWLAKVAQTDVKSRSETSLFFFYPSWLKQRVPLGKRGK